jgi:hypothetical protein
MRAELVSGCTDSGVEYTVHYFSITQHIDRVRCRVYPLRRRGRRLPWREVANATPFEGDLSTYYLTLKNERYFVAQLLGPGDAFRKALLPELYEPVLTNLGNGVLVLRGFEREGEAATVQEWRCEVAR